MEAVRRRRALVVGVDDYSQTPFDDLELCTHDAQAIAEALSMPEYGFEIDLLLDQNATRAAVLEALSGEFDSELETYAFFFAGHGGLGRLGAHLITYDGRPYSEGVELDLLVQLLTRISQGGTNTVAFLDCCQSGAVSLSSSALTKSALRPSEIEVAFSHGTGSRAVLAACLADELSEEVAALGHGRFTFHLLEGLYGGAADSGGRITPSSLHEFVSPRLEESAGQTPAYYAAIAGSVPLADGLAPQLGPKLEEHELAELEDEAARLIADYRTRLGSPQWADWAEGGFASACALLEQVSEWFERQVARQPNLRLRPKFVQAHGALMRYRSNIGVLEPQLRLPEGTVDHPIGSGGFGTVWRVRSSDGGSDMAYKVYHAQDLADHVKSSRFRRGYQAMQRLQHPRVVRVTRMSEVPLGFMMSYIEGANLRDVNPARTQEPAALIRILIEIAEAVAHAHSRDVIHRDIKPENIVCRYRQEEGTWDPYLTDFDLAWINTSSQVTREGIGNYLYAAPEQLMNFTVKAVTGFRPTLDVFSLGQLAYFCVTGSDPNPTRSNENAENIGRALSQWPSGEAAALMRELYEHATREDARQRLESVNHMLEALFEVERAMLPEQLAGHLPPSRFRAELVFGFTGRAVPDETGPETEFGSVSEQTRIIVSHKQRDERRVDLTVKLLPAEAFGLEGQSNEALRRRLNNRVDTLVEHLEGVRSRPGDIGPFSIYIEFRSVPLDRTGVSKVRSVLTAVLQVVEGAA